MQAHNCQPNSANRATRGGSAPRPWAAGFLLALAATLLMACGGGSSAPATAPAPATASAVIGPAGGTLTGPDGLQVVIPAGALDAGTTIGIARSAAGAPDAPEAYPASGFIYELTPHGITFNIPVTVRAPLPAGATTPLVFMASQGEGWKLLDAEVVNGMAEWTRNSFSNLLIGTACFVPTAMSGDPYWCRHASSYATIAATPAAAMVQTGPIDQIRGDMGNRRMDQAATLQFTTHFSVPGNYRNVTVELRRFTYVGSATRTWSLPIIVQTKTPTLTVVGGVLRGVETFDFPIDHTLPARNRFAVVVKYDYPGVARASGSSTVTGWDYGNYRSSSVGDGLEVTSNIPVPTAFFTVGGTVSGLTSTGLVLRNNGANNLSLAANATAFTFAAPVNAGSAYNVSVLTQPVGQACTVQNGSGTTNANVSNVAVSCVGASAPTATDPLSSMGGHTCAVKGDFTVACWGNNSNYALGDGTAVNRTFPVAVTGLTGVESVSVGTTHSCALKSDKTVWCWGANDFRQIGLNSAGAFPTPTQVAGLSGVAALSAGRTHNCVLKTDGTVACWGRNHLGQLGDGTTTDSFAPVVVSGLSGVSMLNGGWDRTCAVTAGGGVVCWGDLNYSLVGGLPVATVAPQTVAGLTGAVSVSSGGNYHACALKSDSTVACWGYNGDGALGNGTNVGGLTAVTASGLTDAAKVSTASGHSCAIRTNGSVMCWGNNSRGQLGDNTTTPKNAPVSVVGLAGATAIATGGAFSCVLKTDGSAACWGYNLEGYLGDLSMVEKHLPSAVFGGAVFWK